MGEAAVERCVVSVVGCSVHASMVTEMAEVKGDRDRLHRAPAVQVESKSPLTCHVCHVCHVHLYTVGMTETQHQLSSLQRENRL